MKFHYFFHKITQISFNIGLRILNLHTLGHPFPSAGHTILFKDYVRDDTIKSQNMFFLSP